jgi:hypothetical protein
MKNRFRNYIFAIVQGYFWLSCPICGKKFGGHEWDFENGNTLYISPNEGRGVCPDCGEIAKKINAKTKYGIKRGNKYVWLSYN